MTNKFSSKKPLDPKTDDPVTNSQLHAATTNQSSVVPEDYPLDEREGQTAVVEAPNVSKRKRR